jgi:predicted DNA-binding ribbon-helix-helix protein
MSSSLMSRNITVAGRRTSMRLEPEMWDALSEICRREHLTAHDICTLVEARRRASSLTAALRVFIMDYFRTASTEDGHVRAGHGTEPVIVSRIGREGQGMAAPDPRRRPHGAGAVRREPTRQARTG